MRRCFLHIGPHKTGSSSIQRFILENRNSLGNAGFYVPCPERDTPKGNHTHLIADHASGLSPQQTDLARELNEHGHPPNLVISSEKYINLVTHPGFLDWGRDYFAALGYDLTVIAYVRPQVALINSSYTQRAKHLLPIVPFKKHLRRWSAAPDMRSYCRRYAALMEAKGFGVMFVPFTAQLTRNGLCEDFARRLSLPESVIASCPPARVANVSPGPKTVAAFRKIFQDTSYVIDGASKDLVTSLASQLRQMMAAKGWDAQKFDGLYPKDKDALIRTYSGSNEDFARKAWGTSWYDIFGADDEAIRTKPRNVFERKSAEPAERKEFDDFSRDCADFVFDFLRRS